MGIVGLGLIFSLVFTILLSSPKAPEHEPSNNSTRVASLPKKMNKEEMLVPKIPAEQKAMELKSELPQRHSESKTYVKISPPTKEPFSETGKPDGKKDELKQAPSPIELNPPKSAIYHFNVGVFYQGEGKLKEAKEEYEKALSLDPLNVEVHNNLGMVYKYLGRLDMAIAKYRKAIALDPQYKKAHCNLATALYLKGDLDAATSESKLAIALDPNDLEGYNILGLIYKKQNKTHEAIEIFKKALAIDPGHPQTHYNLAILLEKLGNLQGAIFHYQKFIDLSRSREDNQDLVGKVVKHLERLSSSY